jgi:hypothetical protein
VPYAVPMRHVQRSVDTEVLSRRWELQVLGFSHQVREELPCKRERERKKKSLGGVAPVLYICFTYLYQLPFFHVAQARSLES